MTEEEIALARRAMVDAAQLYYSSRDRVRGCVEKLDTKNISINGISIDAQEFAANINKAITDEEILAAQIKELKKCIKDDKDLLADLILKVKDFALAKGIVIL